MTVLLIVAPGGRLCDATPDPRMRAPAFQASGRSRRPRESCSARFSRDEHRSPKRIRHAQHATKGSAQLLVRDHADRQARRTARSRSACSGRTSCCFSTPKGEPAALEDRCCHRTAKLSKGWIKNGNIVCGYHGWEYDRDGKLVNIPQFPFEQAVPDARAILPRQGALRLCLGLPRRAAASTFPICRRRAIPASAASTSSTTRWNCSALRMMENSFDNAHFAFVHKGTFGDINQPKPEKYEITETEYGFVAETIVAGAETRRRPRASPARPSRGPSARCATHWFMPFCRTMDMEYPSGLRHVIFNSATPIDDGSIQLVQILFRNDREEDCSTEELIAWDTRDHRGGPRDARIDRSRRDRRHEPQARDAHALRPAGHADAQAAERAARSARRARGPALSVLAPTPVALAVGASRRLTDNCPASVVRLAG